MMKNNKPSFWNSSIREQKGYQPKPLNEGYKPATPQGGYQPTSQKLPPLPPSNPPNQGSGGKKR